MFVPEDFTPPESLTGPETGSVPFRLVPLGVVHNERDHRAWMASIDHIRRSPGFAGRSWPHPMTIADNARDLVRHAEDFAARRGFTYTVLDDADDVIGCVYIYPDDETTEGDLPGGSAAHVRSWVRADHADLDLPLRRTVRTWLARRWPFDRVRYDGVPPSTPGR